MIATPMGMKITPTTIKQLITHLGVRMGCHALSFCCLNAESEGRLLAEAAGGAIVKYFKFLLGPAPIQTDESLGLGL